MSVVPPPFGSQFTLDPGVTQWQVLAFKGEAYVAQLVAGVLTLTPWGGEPGRGRRTLRLESSFGSDLVDFDVSQGGRLIATLGKDLVRVGLIADSGVDVWPVSDVPPGGLRITVSEENRPTRSHYGGGVVDAARVLVTGQDGRICGAMRATRRGSRKVSSELGNPAIRSAVAGEEGDFLAVSSDGDLIGLPISMTSAKPLSGWVAVDFCRDATTGGATCVLTRNSGVRLTVWVARFEAKANPPQTWTLGGSDWISVTLPKGFGGFPPLVVKAFGTSVGNVLQIVNPMSRSDAAVEVSAESAPARPARLAKFIDVQYPWDIFISYSNPTESGEHVGIPQGDELAGLMYRFLKAKGFRVFWDRAQVEDGLAPAALGSGYKKDFSKILNGSLAMLAIWSSRTAEPIPPDTHDLGHFSQFDELEIFAGHLQEEPHKRTAWVLDATNAMSEKDLTKRWKGKQIHPVKQLEKLQHVVVQEMFQLFEQLLDFYGRER